MNRREYELIQERLSAKLHRPPTDCNGRHLNSREEDGFKIGVLSAKSILSELYHKFAENEK